MQVLKYVIECIEERFDQKGFQIYKQLENLILMAARGVPFKEEFEKVIDFYGSDFDSDLLERQLMSFSALFSDSKNITFTEIVKVMKGLTQAFFCTKPKNSVPDFQKLRSQKSRKTQFLPKNSVLNVSKTGFLGRFSAKINPKI